jgi:large repetitive protein
MRNLLTLQHRREGASARVRWSNAAAAVAIVLGVVGLAAAPALAAGTTSNAISASGAPSAGSTHGTYTPSATASSGDKVAITLDKGSSGCSLSDGKVTFTGSGNCVVDFNDPGNTTYAAAAQVTQSIKVYSGNTISTSTFPSAGSAGGAFAPGATATSGDKVVMTLDKNSSGCALDGGWIDFKSSGTCIVNLNDLGNGAFAAASQVQRSVKVYSSNTISASTPPAAGAIHGTYSPSASVTSGDKVAISLNSESTGCSLSDGKVTFTDNGVCVIDFNDAGNGSFAPASEVKQTITVGSGNPKTQGSITITSTSTHYGLPLTLSSTGGSGSGATSYTVTAAGSANCSISGDTLTSKHAGTCVVTAIKASDGTYAAASSLATTITVIAPAPRAIRLSSAVWSGRTMTTRIVGLGFYGRPLIVSSLVGTSAVVTHDNGRVLTIRVVVARGSHSGHYRFTIIFARGQRASVRYMLR